MSNSKHIWASHLDRMGPMHFKPCPKFKEFTFCPYRMWFALCTPKKKTNRKTRMVQVFYPGGASFPSSLHNSSSLLAPFSSCNLRFISCLFPLFSVFLNCGIDLHLLHLCSSIEFAFNYIIICYHALFQGNAPSDLGLLRTHLYSQKDLEAQNLCERIYITPRIYQVQAIAASKC